MTRAREQPSGDASGALVLLGLRCCGKSAVGCELAGQLERPFLDLDRVLVELQREETGREAVLEELGGAGELLAELGEPAFRDLEQRALERALARTDRPVLASGAGVVERAANRSLLARRSTCVWLDVALPILRLRMAQDATFRPALEGSDPISEVERVAQRRTPLYVELADLVVDCGEADAESLARRIARWLGSN